MDAGPDTAPDSTSDNRPDDVIPAPNPWFVSGGALNLNYLYAAAVDLNGNGYIVGSFGNAKPITFGTSALTSYGRQSAFVAKLTPSGKIEWVKTFGGNDVDRAFGVAVSNAGDIYITGTFQKQAKFGPTTLKSTGSSDAFVLKLDDKGNLVWVHQLGASKNASATSVVISGNQSVTVVGTFEGTVPGGNLSSSTTHGFVASFDQTGRKETLQLKSQSIAVHDVARHSGTIYICGDFRESLQIGTKTINASEKLNQQGFVARLILSQGKTDWVTVLESTGGNKAKKLLVHSKGIYVTGNQAGRLIAGSSILDSTNTGSTDVYLASIDLVGKVDWGLNGGSTANDDSHGMTMMANQRLWITGRLGAKGTFGTHKIGHKGAKDIFVAAIDVRTRSWVEAASVGSTDEDVGHAIAAYPGNRTALLAGVHRGDFGYAGSNRPNKGKQSIFALLLDSISSLSASP